MNTIAIVVLTVLWLALTILLAVLIKKWYVQKSTDEAKGKRGAAELEEMIRKSRGVQGRSTVPKDSLKEKLSRVDIDILVAQVKTWLKEADRDKLTK